MIDEREMFRRLLVPLWLRPERALWDAHELAAVRRMLGPDFGRPALEYGCTEGVNTFVMLGGAFGIDADDYEDLIVAGTADSARQSSGDYFSTFDENVRTFIDRPADACFDVGISWRDAHIVKSRRLGVYKELYRVDLDSPLKVVEDRRFKTIWSPNLFWSAPGRLTAMLAEQRSLLEDDGRVLTILPDAAQCDADLWRHLSFMPSAWRSEMGEAVGQNLVKNARSDTDWRRSFDELGLTVSAHEQFLPRLTSVTYEIGLRPMFPVFLDVYARLKRASIEEWRSVKRQWIDTVFHFLGPLCERTIPVDDLSRPLWHLYELRRAS